MQNNKRGRDCLFTGYAHVKFDGKPLGEEEDLWEAVEKLEKGSPASTLLELLLKIGNGVCIKSIPFDTEFMQNVQLVFDCTDSDGHLIHLPFPGSVPRPASDLL